MNNFICSMPKFVAAALVILAGSLSLPVIAQDSVKAQLPSFNFTVTPKTLTAPVFEIEGSISFCQGNETKVQFITPKHSTFTFARNGYPINVNEVGGINWKCASDTDNLIYFKGESGYVNRCAASKGELYCLNNSAPNPEIAADASAYDISFILPKDYAALQPDKELALKNGIQFQIAMFDKPVVHKGSVISFEYIFPKGFAAETRYIAFLENVIKGYVSNFGKLPYDNLKIGAIRREEDKGTISGAPAGNLILFSRTALSDPPKIELPKDMGITKDITDPIRKLVIAHELSHFWFGDKHAGRDGWMVEGIPQYLGLYEVFKDSRENFAELMKFFEYYDKHAPQDEIPNSGLNSKNGYMKAYYQAPVALVYIGNDIGHENLVRLIVEVFSRNSNPAFADFTRVFKSRYPSKEMLWETAWRIK